MVSPKKDTILSRGKRVVGSLGAGAVLSYISVGMVGLPGVAAGGIGWAAAELASRGAPMTAKKKRITTAVIGVVGAGMSAWIMGNATMPGYTGMSFAAGTLTPFLVGEFARRRALRNATSARQANTVIEETRPERASGPSLT